MFYFCYYNQYIRLHIFCWFLNNGSPFSSYVFLKKIKINDEKIKFENEKFHIIEAYYQFSKEKQNSKKPFITRKIMSFRWTNAVPLPDSIFPGATRSCTYSKESFNNWLVHKRERKNEIRRKKVNKSKSVKTWKMRESKFSSILVEVSSSRIIKLKEGICIRWYIVNTN